MEDVGTEFPRLMGKLDYPMYVVTAEAGGERAGCLVGFATQCSIHPARFIVCVSKKNRTYEVARRALQVGVHVLGPGDVALAGLFGSETGHHTDKFAHCRWHSGPAGVPILDDCSGWFTGQVVERVDGGDHGCLFVEPTAAALVKEPVGLGFQALKGMDPGHDP